MNGIHDLGGMHGLGQVERERNEPVFHTDWERRVFAMTLASACAVKWNVDMGRYAREQMPPAEYLATSYYEHWMFGLERLRRSADAGSITRTGASRSKVEPALRAASGSVEEAIIRPAPKPTARIANVVPTPAKKMRAFEDMIVYSRNARLSAYVPPQKK